MQRAVKHISEADMIAGKDCAMVLADLKNCGSCSPPNETAGYGVAFAAWRIASVSLAAPIGLYFF